jgi:hypothetical protein
MRLLGVSEFQKDFLKRAPNRQPPLRVVTGPRGGTGETADPKKPTQITGKNMEREAVIALDNHRAEGVETIAAAPAGGWEGVCDELRSMVSHDAFQRWFRAARWLGCENGVATVAVPGEIHQVWIETN